MQDDATARLRLCLLAGAAGLLITMTASACGGDDGGGGADAGADGVDAGPGLAIESSLPADGASPVSVLADVAVTLTGDADPATVTADSVQLWKTTGGDTRFFGPVAYDAESRTISLAPFDALDHGTTFELRLRGVSGPDGALPDSAISFSTTRNSWTRSTAYAADAITSWNGKAYDADGYEIHYFAYNGAGDDTDWYTDDDVPTMKIDTERDEQHRATRLLVYSGAALALVQTTVNTYDGAGDKVLEVNYDPDDAIVLRRVSTYDAGHRLLRGTQFSEPGDDGDWGTDDDVASFAEGYVYDADGLTVRRAVYGDPGANDTWGDDDDIPDAWVEYQYSAEGQLARRVSHSGPGDDGDWFSPDDPVTGYVQYVRDDQGRQIRNVRYKAPGDNGTWFNSDDVVNGYDAFTPFAKSLYADDRYITGPGDNGSWFNSDDVVSSLYVDTYATSGDLLSEKEIDDPGDDGDWGTDDDPIAYLGEWMADLP